MPKLRIRKYLSKYKNNQKKTFFYALWIIKKSEK